jgi:hypothetical protein
MKKNKPKLYFASSDTCSSPVNLALRCNDQQPGLFAGCYLIYSWAVIETGPGRYDWSNVLAELDLCESFGLKAFLTLRDKRWVWFLKDRQTHAVPRDLLPLGQFEKQQQFTGTPSHLVRVAKRWDANVQARFLLFLAEAGKALSGHPALAAFEVTETSLGYQNARDLEVLGYPGAREYSEIMMRYMHAARIAFPKQDVFLALNWMPGARTDAMSEHIVLFEYAKKIGVGISVTDIAPQNFPEYVDAVYKKFAAYKGKIPLAGKMERSSYRLWEPGRGHVGVDWVFGYVEDTLMLDYLVLQDDPMDAVTKIGFYESVMPYLKRWMAK